MTKEAYEFDAENVLSPAYWNGHDPLAYYPRFLNQNNEVSLDDPLYQRAKIAFEFGAWELYNNESPQISYQQGTRFGPTTEQLGDGSVFVVEYEGLIKNIGTKKPPKFPQANNIYQPFVDYWKSHLATMDCGVDGVLIPEHKMHYSHVLRWGVLVSDPQQNRALQTFEFRSLLPQEDGSFKYDADKLKAIPLPLEVGGVNVGISSTMKPSKLAAFKLSGLHLVYPRNNAKPDKPPRRLSSVPGII